MYGSKARVMTRFDVKLLIIFEKKILRRVYVVSEEGEASNTNPIVKPNSDVLY